MALCAYAFPGILNRTGVVSDSSKATPLFSGWIHGTDLQFLFQHKLTHEVWTFFFFKFE